jgi:hypothetical protein
MGRTFQEIVINAPTDTVWQRVRSFHDLSWAANVITDLKVVGDKADDEPGAGRVLNDVFHETLMTHDDEAMIFTYSIDDGPPPLSKDEMSNYVGRVAVEASGDGTRVEWTSSWEQNEDAIQEFCHGIYTALLADLKKSLE